MKMKIVTAVLLSCACCLVALPVSSQETDDSAATTAAAPAPAVSMQAKEIAIYGEIKIVNPAANSVSVQYYDYDSDEEKTIEVFSGKETKIENAPSLADIRNGDWADVTYTVSEGKNVAKTIKVEKELPTAASETDATEEPSEE